MNLLDRLRELFDGRTWGEGDNKFVVESVPALLALAEAMAEAKRTADYETGSPIIGYYETEALFEAFKALEGEKR